MNPYFLLLLFKRVRLSANTFVVNLIHSLFVMVPAAGVLHNNRSDREDVDNNKVLLLFSPQKKKQYTDTCNIAPRFIPFFLLSSKVILNINIFEYLIWTLKFFCGFIKSDSPLCGHWIIIIFMFNTDIYTLFLNINFNEDFR